MKFPLPSFDDYLKDPLKYIQFLLILVVGYLWWDGKTNYEAQINNCSSDVERLELRINELSERVRKSDSTLARAQGILSVIHDRQSR
jgi:hypothetical protein